MSLVLWCKTAYKKSFLEEKQKELLASGEYSQVVIKGAQLYIERLCEDCKQPIDGFTCWKCVDAKEKAKESKTMVLATEKADQSQYYIIDTQENQIYTYEKSDMIEWDVIDENGKLITNAESMNNWNYEAFERLEVGFLSNCNVLLEWN